MFFKFFEFLINFIFWMWLFLVPTAILGLIGLWLYFQSDDNLIFFIILTVLGIVIGVMIAEHVRKKQGLDRFFGSIHGSPDVVDRGVADEVIDSK
jgi:hypothetical protein